jgi:hypothetical protein
MNVVLAAVSSSGKVIFELEEEDRLHRRQSPSSDENTIHLTIHPKGNIDDFHDMSYALFLEVLAEVEEHSVKKFGSEFKLLKFVFYGFARCCL